jgi:hypothetical protein
MVRKLLTATEILNSELVADLAFRAVTRHSSEIRENLLMSKNEQTFSGLLASELNSLPTLRLGDSTDDLAGIVLLEYKGKDYVHETPAGHKYSRNSHDLVIVNPSSEIEVIIENKFWYHFDGCKGFKTPKPEKGIEKQLLGDIYKIRQTLDDDNSEKKGFILLNVVTPFNPEEIPSSYLNDHKRVWERTKMNRLTYRKEGLDGVMSVLEMLNSEFNSISVSSTGTQAHEGFIDFICAEVRLNG